MKTIITCFSVLFSVNFIECSFRCDYKYSVVAKGWFKHFVVPATWYDARLRCALEGAVLLSPITQELEDEMSQILKNFFTSESEIFTGIHATFSDGNYFSIEGIPLSDIPLPWAEHEPDNMEDDERCLIFNGNGDLADRMCEETRPYICYRNGSKEVETNECGTVDNEYRLDTRTKSCYKFHTVPRTFARAHFACSAEGGHLVIINSETEAQVLREIFAKYQSGTMPGLFWKNVAFIGFQDWGERGDWRTIHGETLSEAGYAKFSPGEPANATPGEFCGSIYRTALLNDLWCDKPAPFICEKRPDHPAVCHPLADEENTIDLRSNDISKLRLDCTV
uniref:C-type lectin domain-containing protein n=1 Tax=Heliothis virescens TaxID=7102 RepID=A0A2A4IYF0_HELVI